MLKAVLCDLDGTLIDSEIHYVRGTYTWMKEAGCDRKLADFYSLIGLTMAGTYDRLQEFMPGMERAEIIRRNEEYFNFINPLKYDKILYSDVREFFNYLNSRAIKIAICSMDSREEIASFIAQCHLEEDIYAYYSGQDCSQNKPDPEIWLKALSDLKLEKDEVIALEDSYNGILSAKRAGLYVYARKDIHGMSEQGAADYIFEDLKEVKEDLNE